LKRKISLVFSSHAFRALRGDFGPERPDIPVELLAARTPAPRCALDTYAHQELPIRKTQTKIRRGSCLAKTRPHAKTLSRPPLFQAMFCPAKRAALPALEKKTGRLKPTPAGADAQRTASSISMRLGGEHPGGLNGISLNTNTGLFQRGKTAVHAAAWVTINAA